MKILTHNLGYPRIGPKRELKRALESFWAGKSGEAELLGTAGAIRKQNWLLQKSLGINLIPSNDFSLYDHVLDTAALTGALPRRFRSPGQGLIDLTTYFTTARGYTVSTDGCSGCGVAENAAAMEMTKWMDTNYHYLVPELEERQSFHLASTKPVDEFKEAKALGVQTMPVLLGPISFLLLSKSPSSLDRLSLLPALTPVYTTLLKELEQAGAEWVQLDEPALVLDLNDEQRAAYEQVYLALRNAAPKLKLMVAAYFGELRGNMRTALQLPIDCFHMDAIRGESEVESILRFLPQSMSLSVGIIDGRNVWRNDYNRSLQTLKGTKHLQESGRLIISPSCSLLHVPVSLKSEARLDTETTGWLAFAEEKLQELVDLREILERKQGSEDLLAKNQAVVRQRLQSTRIHHPMVKTRLGSVEEADLTRKSPFPTRFAKQRAQLLLPLLPTTTIGSFPQTEALRAARAKWKRGEMGNEEYERFLQEETKTCVQWQEQIGIDVLVHGEFERTDMVEYFGERLAGFAFTENGWVQSYGSRCVKPPIIFGDVHRVEPMTLRWAQFAQSLTHKPVKGMLTGPITILQWSFVRDDQPRKETAWQIALAIRDEVIDLENGGIEVIQIDEPALREGLPLRRSDWDLYLDWAVKAFRLAASGVNDETQIHTHMCYCEFNQIIDAIAALDADVISIEASRSRMELLDAFVNYNYPNEIGPGVWDIHSPRVPSTEEMLHLVEAAGKVIPRQRLWINPDCGLKTRRWEEVKPALLNLVNAARQARASLRQP